MQDIGMKLQVFVENEGKSCSMEICGITPKYEYRMWGGEVPINAIEESLKKMFNEIKQNII